jgi:hypothetical protein
MGCAGRAAGAGKHIQHDCTLSMVEIVRRTRLRSMTPRAIGARDS